MNNTNDDIKKLNYKSEQFDVQINLFNEQINEIQQQINQIRNEKKIISDKIYKIKDDLIMQRLIEDVKKIDIDNLLSTDEIRKIYNGMDKYDYTDGGIKPWLDFDKLVNSTIKVKNKYQSMNFVLFEVNLVMSESGYSPTTYYNLKFKDNDGLCFTTGC